MKDNSNKINKFLLITTILSMVILLVGGTFSYFTLSTMSKMNALAVSAGKVRLGLGVSPVYTGYPIIPLLDKDVSRAYNQKCKDDLEQGVCLAYTLEIFNYEEQAEVEGFIDFNLNGIENLSYMVLDENNNTYVDVTHIDKDNYESLPLGKEFILSKKVVDSIYPSKKFTLLIWLTENNKEQRDTDAGKAFSADITFKSTEGGRLTASVEGMKSISEDSPVIGG